LNKPNHTYRPITVSSLFIAHNSQAALYAFASKEKDVETGLSYFGARYYYSDLSIWLSVDPMSWKYPYQSNYVYCSNNPIKVIDPNGEDEYEFDESGYLINRIANDRIDIIHIVDKSGNRTASSKSYVLGTICNLDEDVPSNHSSLENATIFEVENGEASAEFHQFLSQNTNVEWGEINAEDADGNCVNFVGTNHNVFSTNISSIVSNMGYSIERSSHNHPNDISSVSDGDHFIAMRLELMNPNVQLYNYTKSNGYTRYSSKDGYVDKKGVSHYPTLDPVIIKSQQ